MATYVARIVARAAALVPDSGRNGDPRLLAEADGAAGLAGDDGGYRVATWNEGYRSRGLVLEDDQRALLERLSTGRPGWWALRRMARDDRKELADRWGEDRKAVRLLLERGLRFSGECPRCQHWMVSVVSFGVAVDPTGLEKMIEKNGLASAIRLSWSNRLFGLRQPELQQDAGSTPDNPTLTFVCSCGRDHAGRPPDTPFAGCGVAWTQRTRPDDHGDLSLEPAPPEEATWAGHIKELSAAPLARIRSTANQWRNGVTGLTAVLTAVAVLKGPSDAAKLTSSSKWLTLGLSSAGLASLLLGAYKALQASFGVAGYDHRLLSTHAVRRYERRRAREAIGQIHMTQLCTLVGVLLVAAGAGVAFAGSR